MRKKRVRTTPAQRTAMEKLRKRLGERGYVILPVARWYRRHYLDFLALPKLVPREFVLVRPSRNGTVSVRPFASPQLYGPLQAMLQTMQHSCDGLLHWSDRMLPFARVRPDDWPKFIAPEGLRETQVLVFGRAASHNEQSVVA